MRGRRRESELVLSRKTRGEWDLPIAHAWKTSAGVYGLEVNKEMRENACTYHETAKEAFQLGGKAISWYSLTYKLNLEPERFPRPNRAHDF